MKPLDLFELSVILMLAAIYAAVRNSDDTSPVVDLIVLGIAAIAILSILIAFIDTVI